MDRDRARVAVAGARVARLATRTATGRVDLVPVTFALVGERLCFAVDHKPKTTTRLGRLANIRAHPEVSVLVDHYDDDWAQLWWVRLRGNATIHGPVDGPATAGDDPRDLGIAALVGKYPQYRRQPPAGDVVVIDLVRWQWWSATP